MKPQARNTHALAMSSTPQTKSTEGTRFDRFHADRAPKRSAARLPLLAAGLASCLTAGLPTGQGALMTAGLAAGALLAADGQACASPAGTAPGLAPAPTASASSSTSAAPVTSITAIAPAASPVLSTTELSDLISRCAPGIAPATMLALVRTESSGNPFAIGVVGGSLKRQPRSLEQALATVQQLKARGQRYSAGLAQIYERNFASLGLAPESAFNPCENLRAGARVLSHCYEGTRGSEAERLSAAFSCYYSGDPVRGRALGYSERVARNAGVAHPAFLAQGAQSTQSALTTQSAPWLPRAPPETKASALEAVPDESQAPVRLAASGAGPADAAPLAHASGARGPTPSRGPLRPSL